MSFTHDLQFNCFLGQANLYRFSALWKVSRLTLTFSLSKIDSNYLDKELNVFKDRNFRLIQNLAMGEANFNQFMRLRNQLGITAKDVTREKNLSPVLIPTMSQDLGEQRKLAHKVVHVVGRANRKVSVILLRYNEDKPEN